MILKNNGYYWIIGRVSMNNNLISPLKIKLNLKYRMFEKLNIRSWTHWIDAGVWIDLQRVLVFGCVLKESVGGVEHFTRQKKQPLPSKQNSSLFVVNKVNITTFIGDVEIGLPGCTFIFMYLVHYLWNWWIEPATCSIRSMPQFP